MFVVTKVCFLSVVTKVLLRQKCFVTTKLLSQEIFVKTNLILSWQQLCHDKHIFVATKDVFCVCHDKTFVATKMILVAAPANDSLDVMSPDFQPI